MTDGQLRVRVVPIPEVDPSLEERWRRLADEAVEPNPYHDPRFLLTSARHRDDARSLRLAVVEDDEELLAVLAFDVRRSFLRSRVRVASTTGPFLREVGDLRHPLLSPRDPQRTWEALLGGLRGRGMPGFLELANLTDGGPVAMSLLAAVERLRLPFVEIEGDERAHASIDDLPATDPSGESDPEAPFVVEHQSAGSRKDHRRRVRALATAAGARLAVTDRGADPAAIRDFLDLEAAGWKGDPARGGHALRTIGADGWFVAVTDAFRADGRLAVCAVTAGSRSLFLGVGIRAGDGMFAVLDSYDETLAHRGAGRIGRIAEWRSALREPGIRFFDPNLSSVYRESTRLYPQRRRHMTLLLATGGVRARTLLRAVTAARRIRG